jgi:hypothetical protein
MGNENYGRHGFYTHPHTLDAARMLVRRVLEHYILPAELVEGLAFYPCEDLPLDRIEASGRRYVELLTIVREATPNLPERRAPNVFASAVSGRAQPVAPLRTMRTARQAETSESLARMLALGMLMDAKREALVARRNQQARGEP